MSQRSHALKLAANLLSWHDDNVEYSPNASETLREAAIMLREQADHIKEQENLNGWAQVVKLTEALDELTVWLNNNTTFYDTEGMSSAVPVLASVSKRIWYHATDDTESYPFSDVIKTEREQQL